MNEPMERTTLKQWHDLLATVPDQYRYDSTPLAATTAEVDAMWAQMPKATDPPTHWINHYGLVCDADHLRVTLLGHPLVVVEAW